MFLDLTALLCKALPTAVTAMVAEEEEEEAVVVAASGELPVVMEVADLLVVEVEVVDLEEVAGTLVVVVAAEEEVTGHATTVVKEATLPEIALTSQRLMQDRAVAEVVVVVVHATATTVESLGILQGIVPQQPVPRETESAAFFSLLSLFFPIH
jgi:hypothetical protein